MDDIQSILNAMAREAVAPTTAAVAIAVIGLNIHFGYTGLLNIGQSAFMLLGAYGFAISITQGWPLIVAFLVGLAVAFVFALVLGVPTLQLRGDYLAIVTISAAEIVRYVGRSVGVEWLFNLTGGAQGIPGSRYRGSFADLSFFGDGRTQLLSFNYTDVAGGDSTLLRLVGWLVVIGLVWLAVRVGRGKLGLEGAPRTIALVGLTILTILMVFFLAPVNQQNTGVNGWWFTAVTWVVVAISLIIVLGLTRSPWGAPSRASARTRTPCAASARTCSPSRCRRWSSVACSERWAACSTCCPRPCSPTPWAARSRSSATPRCCSVVPRRSGGRSSAR